MHIAPEQLKLRTSHLTRMFLETFRTLFRKGGVARVTWPPKF